MLVFRAVNSFPSANPAPVRGFGQSGLFRLFFPKGCHGQTAPEIEKFGAFASY